jgi:3-oxoadipate enol-lactonase
MTAIQRGTVECNNTRLYYESAGAGEPVVLIPGFTLDTRMWDDQFLPLAQHFRVIRYDMRGFGRSALPTEAPYSHVDDLAGLLDHLDIPAAHLVGLSKGGGVALDFALTHPHRVRRLALIDSVLGGFAWSNQSNAENGLIWQEAARGGIPAAKVAWLGHPLFVPAHRQPAVAARLAQIIGDYSGWHFVNDNPEQGIAPPAAARLHELTMPVLALVGDEDRPDFVQISEQIGREVAQARKIVLSGVGHMANMEAAEAVTEALLAFLSGA